MIQRWLNLVLDMVCAFLAVFVVILAVELRSTVSQGRTGVALLNILSLNMNMMDTIEQ